MSSNSLQLTSIDQAPVSTDIILGPELATLSEERKMQLGLNVIQIRDNERVIRSRQASTCLAVARIKTAAGAHGWQEFCRINLAIGERSVQRYAEIGETIENYLKSPHIPESAFNRLTQNALSAMVDMRADIAEQTLINLPGGDAQVNAKEFKMIAGSVDADAAYLELQARVIETAEKLQQSEESRMQNEADLAQARESLNNTTEQLNASEGELHASRHTVEQLRNASRTQQPPVAIIPAPPSVTKEVEARVAVLQQTQRNLEAENRNLTDDRDRLSDQVAQVNKKIAEAAAAFATTEDALKMINNLNDDFGRLVAKYPEAMWGKVVALEKRTIPLLTKFADRLLSFSQQVRPAAPLVTE